MSPEEIQHRIIEQSKKTFSSFSIPKFKADIDISLELPKIPGLIENIHTHCDETQINIWTTFADNITNGQISFLGTKWPPHQLEDRWSFDPVSKKLWPNNRYCFRIPYRHSPDMGDVKYSWEINRLQYLQPIAALCAIRPNPELEQYCVNELESWIDRNPPFLGINWASGIELSCRLISIFFITTLINERAFTPKLKKKIYTTLAYHGYWLFRYPSKHSSANNHLVAEAAGLFILGSLCPWLKQSQRYIQYGKSILSTEANNQILNDGVGAEQSPTYLAFTLEWLLISAIVAKQKNTLFPTNFYSQIKKAVEHLLWITDTKGNQPRIGDDDEGRVVYFEGSSGDYVCSVIAVSTNVVDDNNLSPPSNISCLLTSSFGAKKGASPKLEGSKCFTSGGYSVFRNSINEKNYLLVMDHGPLGYLSIAAHGHADALSVWLNIDGMPVIVDAGTYLYHSGGKWRDHMRSTPAHNTLSVCGEDSSKISGAFNWSDKARTSIISYDHNEQSRHIEAEHDGFDKKYHVKHRRRLDIPSKGVFDISDELIGQTGDLDVEIGFLFHPDLTIEQSEKNWVIIDDNKKPILTLENSNSSLKGSIQIGQRNPLRGWYSEKFSSVQPAPRLSFGGKLTPNQKSLTRISIL